jgi:hypothetical protein
MWLLTVDRVAGRLQLDGYVAELGALWLAFDELYGSLSTAGWGRAYGRHWSFADQPFHLAYFDRIIVAEPLEAGRDLAARERWTLRCAHDIDQWNAREFAKRPAGQTPERSLAELREVRRRIVAALAMFDDSDLDRARIFSHFFDLGFIPLRELVETAGLHNWGELSELRWRLGRATPSPPPAVTHRSVGYYLLTMRGLCRSERASRPFTVQFESTGPGGGCWTMRVGDGACTLAEEAAERPDLSFRMSADTFNLAMVRRAVNPARAMLTGRVRVRGISKLPRFLRLFPQPRPDQPITVRASS